MLLTQAPGYLLAIDAAQVDVFRFEELIGVAHTMQAEGCVVGAAVLFSEALTLWRGAPLADLANEPFAGVEIARLEETCTERSRTASTRTSCWDGMSSCCPSSSCRGPQSVP